jgi:hypothetical protein
MRQKPFEPRPGEDLVTDATCTRRAICPGYVRSEGSLLPFPGAGRGKLSSHPSSGSWTHVTGYSDDRIEVCR